MALFELQGPDGKTYEVDAPDMHTAASAFQSFGVQAREKKSDAPQLSELDKSMDARVQKEAAAGLAPRPSPVEYTPIGSWVDEGAAMLDAGLGKITGEGLALTLTRKRKPIRTRANATSRRTPAD